MLEDIIHPLKKSVLRAVILSSLLPSSSQAYTSSVRIDGNERQMQVCEDSKIIQAEAKDWSSFKRAKMFSLIYHERSLLESDISDLDYSTYKLVKDAFSQSSILSKKVNTAIKWFDPEQQKVPWEFFLFYGLNLKFFASKEAVKIRMESKDYLNSFDNELSRSPIKTHNNIEALRERVKVVRHFIEETNDLTNIDLPFTLEEMTSFAKDTKRSINYLNFKKLEKTKGEISDRIKKTLEESGPGKNYIASKNALESKKVRKMESPFSVLDDYLLVNLAPESAFKEEYLIETATINNQNIPEKVLLEVSARKLCKTKTGYDLVLDLKIDGLEELINNSNFNALQVIEPLKTSINLIYPGGTLIGEVSESARLVYSKEGRMSSKIEEIIPSSTDKIMLEASKATFDKSLHIVAEGNILRIKNVLEYFSEKISDAEKARDQAPVDLIKERLKGYDSKEIKLFNSGRQGVEFIISVPLSNIGKKPIYILADIGIRDWNDQAKGRLEDLIVKIDNTDLTRVGEPHYPGWIIPAMWIDLSNDTLIVTIPTVMGSTIIDPDNGRSEYATVKIADTRYSFIDKDFVNEYQLLKSTDSVLYVIQRSTGPLRFQYAPEGLYEEDGKILNGVFFAEEDKLKEYIRKNRSSMTNTPTIGYPNERDTPVNEKKMRNPFYGIDFGGGLLGNVLGEITRPYGGKNEKYIDPEKMKKEYGINNKK